jgi:hypothetical protein
MTEQSDTKKLRFHLRMIQFLQSVDGLWFPAVKWILDRTLRYLSIGYRLNEVLDRKSLGGAWVSESYQSVSVGLGLIWIAFIKLPVLTGLVWRGLGAAVAFYRLLEIFLFSLHWLVVAKGPVESYRRSLAGFVLNLCEIGIFFAIAYLLLGWFDPPMGHWEALFSSVSGVFRLESLSKIKPGLWPQLFAGVKIVTSWLLVVLIIGNVVGTISRGEKNPS